VRALWQSRCADEIGVSAAAPDAYNCARMATPSKNTASDTEKLNTKAAGVIGLAVMASRVLGLVREQIQAALFGGGRIMDAFTAAFRIPNLLRDLFAEGALSTSFVTVFSRTIVHEGDESAWRLASKIATLAIVVLSVLTIAGIAFAPALISIIAPGFDPEKAALTVTLTRLMFPFILVVSLAALVMGMLNAKNVFGIPAMASSFFNLGSIVGGVSIGYWLDPHFGPRALLGLAVGTLIGGALQLGVQLPALRRLGYRFHPDFRWRDAGVKAILVLMGPSVIAASSTQVNVMINTIFASTLGDGPTFWLNIAFRLMQLPLGVFGVALGTVTLPLLARRAAMGDMDTFRRELARGLRLAFLLTLPATVGLMLLAEPIISVLYQHGRFTAHETAEAAGALRFYAIGLCGYAALKVLVNAFYAIDKRKTPMVVSFLAIGVNLFANWLFTFHLGWGHRGLAFATGCVATTNFLILYALMRRHLQRFDTGLMLKLVSKTVLASAVMGLICWASNHWWLHEWATMHFLPKLAITLGTITVAGAAFFGCTLLLRVTEVMTIVDAVKRRVRRG
jgi:putative peptidoglycan lipid II flippase